MTRRVCAAALLLLLAGCADRLVEVPVDREAAIPVERTGGPLRCPADTVSYVDDDPLSGAGAVPEDFEGRTLLRCRVYPLSNRGGAERFRVEQWRAPLTTELRTALDLPDREIQPPVACAASTDSTIAVYLVDGRGRSVRVLMPYDEPCRFIRDEVAALLPGGDPPPDVTFRVSRPPR